MRQTQQFRSRINALRRRAMATAVRMFATLVSVSICFGKVASGVRSACRNLVAAVLRPRIDVPGSVPHLEPIVWAFFGPPFKVHMGLPNKLLIRSGLKQLHSRDVALPQEETAHDRPRASICSSSFLDEIFW